MTFRGYDCGVSQRYSSNGSAWPTGINSPGQKTGFTDEQLEYLANRANLPRRSLPFFGRQYIYFANEIYGNGRALRSVVQWPHSFPIPVNVDHSVNLSYELEKGEVASSSFTHLVFPTWRNNSVNRERKRIFQTVHPWVRYRRQMGYSPGPEACGTLVFIDHGTTEKKSREVDWESYFSSFAGLSQCLRPTAILLHSNDIENGIHRHLRRFNLPIFTLGNRFDPMFVDRFYDLVGKFKYTTSTLIGSHVFLSEEYGVKFFIHGPRRIDALVEGPNRIGTWEGRFEEAMTLWSAPVRKFGREKRDFVSNALGLSEESRLNLIYLRAIFVIAFCWEVVRRVAEVGNLYLQHLIRRSRGAAVRTERKGFS